MPPFYYRLTEGIRITVRPSFLGGQSRPSLGRFVFGYAVRIENVGAQRVQLLTRYWRIHDSVGAGEDHEVHGEGVVGEQPIIDPGGIHNYESYVILKSGVGSMEGHYEFVREDKTRFVALIPRFDLDASAEADRH